MVEQRTHKPLVAGSIPAPGTNLANGSDGLHFAWRQWPTLHRPDRRFGKTFGAASPRAYAHDRSAGWQFRSCRQPRLSQQGNRWLHREAVKALEESGEGHRVFTPRKRVTGRAAPTCRGWSPVQSRPLAPTWPMAPDRAGLLTQHFSRATSGRCGRVASKANLRASRLAPSSCNVSETPARGAAS